MGVLLKDMTDIVLLRDEGARKVIHSCMAPGFEVLGTAINTNSEDVRLTYPNFTFMVVLGCMFGKFVPVLEAAEKLWLRGGVMRHCGMVKSRVGLISLGLHPRPDLTVTTGYLCDTSPKSNEIMEESLAIPHSVWTTSRTAIWLSTPTRAGRPFWRPEACVGSAMLFRGRPASR